MPPKSPLLMVVGGPDRNTLQAPNETPVPFSLGTNGSGRYQQVYDASAFAGLSGPQYVTEIAFRRDAFIGHSFDVTISPDFLGPEIRLSTTAASADTLSAVFADNVGADETLVQAGVFHLSSGPPFVANGPEPFDITIDLTVTPATPFVYDPSAGNCCSTSVSPSHS